MLGRDLADLPTTAVYSVHVLIKYNICSAIYAKLGMYFTFYKRCSGF
jgi:hypothetical protein